MLLLYFCSLKLRGIIMPKRQKLCVFIFYWSNTRLGVTDKKGTTHYFPEKRAVISTNTEEARTILKDREKRSKERLRNLMKSHRTKKQIQKLIHNVYHKDGFSMREVLLKKGLVI